MLGVCRWNVHRRSMMNSLVPLSLSLYMNCQPSIPALAVPLMAFNCLFVSPLQLFNFELFPILLFLIIIIYCLCSRRV